MKLAIFAEMILQFDMKPSGFLSGGGEKWQIELIKLLNKNGIKTEVYQYSDKEISINFNNIKINGLGCKYKEANKKFHNITNRNDIDGYFYMTMNLNAFNYANKDKPKIAVSHGIWWDTDIYYNNPVEWLDNYKKWVLNLDKIISVDSNTLHLAQVYIPKHQHKIEVVPNFVDIKLFKKNKIVTNNNFKVLCPRRIHILRGTEPFVLAANSLTEKYNDIEFTVCGRGFGNDQLKYKKMVESNNRINFTDVNYNEMPKIYNSNHISVIPTIGAEGTSLSALESLACEIPIVSTLVGGLSDIVHDGFNGKITTIKTIFNKTNRTLNYNVDDLINKIEWFYLNQDQIEIMGKNGRNLIECSFSKQIWDRKIIQMITKIFEEKRL